MVWQKGEAGVWLDDYDGAERVFYTMSKACEKLGKEHGSVYAVCTINVPQHVGPLDTRLRDAWKALRLDFPTLSVIACGTKKEYQTATAQAVDKWADETFHVEPHCLASQVISSLHLRKLPCLFFLPASSEVIFHSSHWRIDALGACMVLNRLFDLLSRRSTARPASDWHLGHQNLSPSLEDAFGSPNTPTPAIQALAETVRQRNFENSFPSAGLPYEGDSSTSPASHSTRAITLTAACTSALIAACKSCRITVTAAIHAACSDVIFGLSQDNDHDYSTVVSVNLRDHLPAPYGTEAHACSTYVTGITHTVRRVDTFTTRAAQLTAAYRSDWNISEYMVALRSIYKVHGESMQAIAKSVARKPASNVTVSSLGLVEKYLKIDHDDVVVDKFRLGSAIMGRQPTLYIWTFRDELSLSVDFNEAYYESEAIDNLLAGIIACLEKELQETLHTAA